MAARSNPSCVFGRRLKKLREQADIPQDKLGVMIGLDEGTASARMSRYEGGVHEPPYSLAQKIAELLHVPTAYLFCDDDDLAELILRYGKLTAKQRKELLRGLTQAEDTGED
jgi:transcriptional regulator with XRE-family HTH domain